MVEIDPSEFDCPDVEVLLRDLERHFCGVNVALITPDWEADLGIRIRGLQAPAEVLASADLDWRELSLPAEEELPF